MFVAGARAKRSKGFARQTPVREVKRRLGLLGKT